MRVSAARRRAQLCLRASQRGPDGADLRLAMAAGVKRIVAASTNQASKWYEQPWFAGRIDRVTPDDYPRPDTFYGWAKVAYESLGFLYACGSLGRQLEVVQIRIVAPREIDAAAFADRPLRHYLRDITGYISQRDLQQLFVRSVDAESIDDRVRRAVSDLLRRLEQRTHVLEHHQRPRGGRLRTPGRLRDRLRRRHRPDDRPRLRHRGKVRQPKSSASSPGRRRASHRSRLPRVPALTGVGRRSTPSAARPLSWGSRLTPFLFHPMLADAPEVCRSRPRKQCAVRSERSRIGCPRELLSAFHLSSTARPRGSRRRPAAATRARDGTAPWRRS